MESKFLKLILKKFSFDILIILLLLGLGIYFYNAIRFNRALSKPAAFDEIIQLDSCSRLDVADATYQLTQDLKLNLNPGEKCFGIVADGITLDGGEHQITGNMTGIGIFAKSPQKNLTIRNLKIQKMGVGVELEGVIESNVSQVTAESNYELCFLLVSEQNLTLENSTCSDSVTSGIQAIGKINLVNNTINNNPIGLYASGEVQMSANHISGSDFYNLYIYPYEQKVQTISQDNLIDGKKIYYEYGIADKIYDSTTTPDAGMVWCINCHNVIVKDLLLTKTGAGILFENTTDSFIQNNKVISNGYGIYVNGTNNQILNNIANTNVDREDSGHGIVIYGANNIVRGNTVNWNGADGLRDSGTNTIIENNRLRGNSPIFNLGGSNNQVEQNIVKRTTAMPPGIVYLKNEPIEFTVGGTPQITIYPEEPFSLTNSKVRFIPTKEGIYSVTLNYPGVNNYLSRRTFLVGTPAIGHQRYYVRADGPFHGQTINPAGNDTGAMNLSLPEGDEFRTCGGWYQLTLDELKAPMFLIKDIDLHWRYKVQSTSLNPAIKVSRISKFAVQYPQYTFDIPESATPTYLNKTLSNLNLMYDFHWQTFWLTLSMHGSAPTVYSTPSDPSYTDISYLYTGPKIDEFTAQTAEADIRDTEILSSIYDDDTKKSATIQLMGNGDGDRKYALELNLNPQVDSSLHLTYDGLSCPNANCLIEKNQNGQARLVLQLNSSQVHVIKADTDVLIVRKSTDTSGPVASGVLINYSLEVSNPNLINTTNVVLNDLVPNGTTFVSASNNPICDNGDCNSSSQRINWNLGNISPESPSIIVNFTVRVN